jgi:hypothetical protein
MVKAGGQAAHNDGKNMLRGSQQYYCSFLRRMWPLVSAILTLTATQDDFTIGAPSEAYVKTIVAGPRTDISLYAQIGNPRLSQ